MIYVVSGLPRSGTSLMMQMLEAGGLEPLTDGIRRADEDNPRGYYELEKVKRLKEDSSWLDEAEGKVIKVISMLLFDLPPDREYKVIFMMRNLDEILASQREMLRRRGEAPGPDDAAMRKHLLSHLSKVVDFLKESRNIKAISVDYAETVAEPQRTANRLNGFVREMDSTGSARAIDSRLYRQRFRNDRPKRMLP